MTSPRQFDPTLRDETDQSPRDLGSLADDTQAPLLDESVYFDTTATRYQTRYSGEGEMSDAPPPEPSADSSWEADRAEASQPQHMPDVRHPLSQRETDAAVRVGATYRCHVEGCGCEITITRAPAMPAVQRFVDCCGHEMTEVSEA